MPIGVYLHKKGRKHSEETKMKMRERALNPERIEIAMRNLPKNQKGERHPWWGRKQLVGNIYKRRRKDETKKRY